MPVTYENQLVKRVNSGGTNAAGNWEENKSTNGAASILNPGVEGGRNPDSQSNNWNASHPEVNKTFFNPDATTEQVVTGAPAMVYGFVGKVGTGSFTLRDDSAANASATDFPVYTLAVGTQVTFPGAVRMENRITAQCSVGTDEVTIFWRPI